MYTKEDYVEYKDDLEIDDITNEQKMFLDNINKQLIKIEKQLKTKAITLSKQSKKIINDRNDRNDRNDWINDYWIDAEISFHLKENDSEFDAEFDNVLTSLHYSLDDVDKKIREKHYLLDDGIDHNLFRYRNDHPLKESGFHCWIYHELYHHQMDWANILRIGRIWVQINICYQKDIDIENSILL